MLLVHAPGWTHPRALVGYALLVVSVGIVCGAAIVTHRKKTEGARKLKRAHVIIRSLIEKGDGLVHNPGIVPVATADNTSLSGCGVFIIAGSRGPGSPVERWRENVGVKLNNHPFKANTGGWALTQVGNRYSDVLDKLREIEANLENWVE